MAILLNDNLDVALNKPTDNRYGPYLSVNEANTAIPAFKRYHGLTVGILNENIVSEYWYRWNTGTSQFDLVLKQAEPPAVFTGATQTQSGTSGLVRQPLIENRGQYLKGDGTWSDIPTPALPTGAELVYAELFHNNPSQATNQILDNGNTWIAFTGNNFSLGDTSIGITYNSTTGEIIIPPKASSIVYEFMVSLGCFKGESGAVAVDVGLGIDGAVPAIGTYTAIPAGSNPGFTTASRELSISGIVTLSPGVEHRIRLMARLTTTGQTVQHSISLRSCNISLRSCNALISATAFDGVLSVNGQTPDQNGNVTISSGVTLSDNSAAPLAAEAEAGAATEAARADHVHPLPTAEEIGASPLSQHISITGQAGDYVGNYVFTGNFINRRPEYKHTTLPTVSLAYESADNGYWAIYDDSETMRTNSGDAFDPTQLTSSWRQGLIIRQIFVTRLDNNQIILGTPNVSEGKLILRSVTPGEPDRAIFNDAGSLVLDHLHLGFQNVGPYRLDINTETFTAAQQYTLPDASGVFELKGHTHTAEEIVDLQQAVDNKVSKIEGVEVSGISYAPFNGFYVKTGVLNGKPKYTKAQFNYEIYYRAANSKWVIAGTIVEGTNINDSAILMAGGYDFEYPWDIPSIEWEVDDFPTTTIPLTHSEILLEQAFLISDNLVGSIKAPNSADSTKFLRGDGLWEAAEPAFTTLSLSKGGTGAASADAALVSLGAPAANTLFLNIAQTDFVNGIYNVPVGRRIYLRCTSSISSHSRIIVPKAGRNPGDELIIDVGVSVSPSASFSIEFEPDVVSGDVGPNPFNVRAFYQAGAPPTPMSFAIYRHAVRLRFADVTFAPRVLVGPNPNRPSETGITYWQLNGPEIIGAIPRDVAGGFPTLNTIGKISPEQLPTIPTLSDTVPGNLASTAAVGTSSQAARADHVHALPTPADIGASGLRTYYSFTLQAGESVKQETLPSNETNIEVTASALGVPSGTLRIVLPVNSPRGSLVTIKSGGFSANNSLVVVQSDSSTLVSETNSNPQGSFDRIWYLQKTQVSGGWELINNDIVPKSDWSALPGDRNEILNKPVIPSLSNNTPQALASTASAGTSSFASRADHVHAFPTATDIGAATAAQGAKADTALQDQIVITDAGNGEVNGTYTKSASISNTYILTTNTSWRMDTASGGNPTRTWWRIRNVATNEIAYVSGVFLFAGAGAFRTPEELAWSNDNGTTTGTGVSAFPVLSRTHQHQPFSSTNAGFVPRPTIGDDTKFLRGDATWASVPAPAGTGIISVTNGVYDAPQSAETRGLITTTSYHERLGNALSQNVGQGVQAYQVVLANDSRLTDSRIPSAKMFRVRKTSGIFNFPSGSGTAILFDTVPVINTDPSVFIHDTSQGHSKIQISELGTYLVNTKINCNNYNYSGYAAIDFMTTFGAVMNAPVLYERVVAMRTAANEGLADTLVLNATGLIEVTTTPAWWISIVWQRTAINSSQGQIIYGNGFDPFLEIIKLR